MVIVKFKKLDDRALIPVRATEGSAAYDLTAISRETDEENNVYIYHTGLALEIPYGYVGHIYSRSSLYKKDLYQPYSVGVIDSDYRGEVRVIMRRLDVDGIARIYEPGDRVAQMTIDPVETVTFCKVDNLSKTGRETGGFGSTGDK